MPEEDEESWIDKISEIKDDENSEEGQSESSSDEENGDEGPGIGSKILNFFASIGRGVEKTGEMTSRAPHRILEATPSATSEDEEEKELSDRLQDLKRMEEEGVEEEREWLEEEEEEDWEDQRDEELQRPMSERLADVFSGIFGGPASRLAGFFTGLDEDLYKANMTISPTRYITMLMGVGLIAAIFSVVMVWLVMGLSWIMAVAPPVIFFLVIVIGRSRPSSKISSRASEINQEIPYALRHMATQLSSGIGLPETMTSVADANYGALSEEFDRTLHEMRTGESMVGALESLRERVESDALEQAVRQIERTLRTGGNLSRTLSILADETAFDLRMGLKDYTNQLNMMGMMYMFGSGVIPPMLIVVMIVGGFMGELAVGPGMFAGLFLGGLPFLLMYMVIMFKRMEPEV